MKKIVIIVICILLLLVSFSAGCVFEEREEKKKDDNEPIPDNTETLNITELSHEPTNPTENDTVKVTAKIKAENELEPIRIIFCYEETNLCTVSGVMTLKQGTEDVYEYDLVISGNFEQGDKIVYHVTAVDSEGTEVDAEERFTVL